MSNIPVDDEIPDLVEPIDDGRDEDRLDRQGPIRVDRGAMDAGARRDAALADLERLLDLVWADRPLRQEAIRRDIAAELE